MFYIADIRLSAIILWINAIYTLHKEIYMVYYAM